LDHADDAVGDNQQAEQTVDHRASRQHDHQQHAQDRVDPGENVGPNDVREAACGAFRSGVALAFG